MKIKSKGLDLNKCGSQFKIWCHDNRFLLKPFLVFLAVYLVAFSAMLIANVHYADDVARTVSGYPGWSAFSRYIDTVASYGLFADTYLTNIAPLPQLIAIFMSAASSLIVVCVVSGREIFKKRWTEWIWRVVATTPLVLCPYFLECMAYQYDAVYMALSVLFVVLPLAFRKRSRLLYMVVLSVGMLGACMTYQASLGIYLTLVIFLTIKDWNEAENGKAGESLKFAVWSAGGFLASLLFFQKFLMRVRDVYVSNEVPEASSFFLQFTKHMEQYFRLLTSDFRALWLGLMILIAVGAGVLFIVRSKRNKILASVVALVGIIAMTLAAYAPYSVLEKPLFATRAMYPIGGCVAALGIYAVSGKFRKAVLMPVAILAWCFFVFALTFGNMLKEQNDYRNMQVGMVMSDLNEILPEMEEGTKTLVVRGQIGFSPVVQNTPKDRYRILRRLLGPTFGKDVPWMAHQLSWTGMPGLMYDAQKAIEGDEDEMEVLRETAFYTIRGDKTTIVVEFKGEGFDFGS